MVAQRSHTNTAAPAEIAVMRQREVSNLVEVQTLDPVKNFRALLPFSNIFIRPLFVKSRSPSCRPDLT